MNTELTTKEQVLEAVRKGLITQRPRWQFVLHTSLAITGLTLALLLTVYLVSLISFVMHQSGAWFAPSFGGDGWFELLRTLPWLLIFLTILFIVIVEVLVRRYSFAYHQPLIYSAFGIIAIVIFAGYMTSITSFHRNILGFFESQRFPVANQIFQHYKTMTPGRVYLGTVEDVSDTDFTIENQHDEELHVVITNLSRIQLGDIDQGDTVVVYGLRNDGTISAQAIRILGKQQAPSWFVPSIRLPRLPLLERFIPNQL